MVKLTTGTSTIKSIINNNWSLNNTDYKITTKSDEDGKIINQQNKNEIFIGNDDYDIEAMDLFKNFYDKDYSTVLQVKSSNISDGEKIFEEIIRILGENTSSKDIPNGWDTVSFDSIDIDKPNFNSFQAEIIVTLSKTGDDP